jgi:hypothetical protein
MGSRKRLKALYSKTLSSRIRNFILYNYFLYNLEIKSLFYSIINFAL